MNIKKSIAAAIILFVSSSCGTDFLDIKPQKSLVVPNSLEDLQGMLDNTSVMNNNTPYMPELSTTDFYVLDAAYRTQSVMAQNAYKWAVDIYEGTDDALDWNQQYQVVYIANLVLEMLDKVEHTSEAFAHEIKGSALFFRAKAFYHLSQQYCKDYNAESAKSDLGIALRLQSDHNIKSVRATVEETYQRILTDLHSAIEFLPVTISVKTRPSKQAGYALLAKVYLQMKDYSQALEFANEALKEGVLTDYNELDSSLDFPFEQFNNEVIYHAIMQYTWFFHESNLIVAPDLLELYDVHDLRRILFYKNNEEVITYRGSYDGSPYLFSGLALDEMHLIKAECLARLDLVDESMKTMKELLVKRNESSFIPMEASSSEDAVEKVMIEKRKQLVFRGIRWSDLRRLNQYPDESVTLLRNVEGVEHKLTPNDPRYVFPLPDIAIRLSGMEQNSRD